MRKVGWNQSSLKDALADLAREEGMRRAAVAILERRIGPRDDGLLAALREADVQTLESLSAPIADASLEDVRVALGG
jgi:hypothetical protein